MARYDYRCADGHTVEETYPMGEAPEVKDCSVCDGDARRVFHTPAAIHFHGPGFYATDVKGKLHRRRRRNPGDDLHKEFDHGTARIADAI